MKKKLIRLPIYEQNVMFLLTDKVEDINKITVYDKIERESFLAMTINDNIKKKNHKGNTVENYCIIIALNPESIYKRLTMGDLAHEVNHAVDYLYERIGEPIECGNGEPQAYLTGYIMNELCKFLNIPIYVDEYVGEVKKNK